ncbi:hypothetical protein LB507_001162 [Fusarium sp. FIESC RH6]|nr:hypothetical protein LB507_001162 [Fusarium sp. FIESC RH6]
MSSHESQAEKVHQDRELARQKGECSFLSAQLHFVKRIVEPSMTCDVAVIRNAVEQLDPEKRKGLEANGSKEKSHDGKEKGKK